MIQFKIFFGTQLGAADDKLNIWLKENPDIQISSFQYEQARYGDHSICIMYETRNES